MKTFFLQILALMIIISFDACNTPKRIIKIKQETAVDNFTAKSLARFISDPENQGASVVVRDPSINKDGVTTNSDINRVCTLVERGLMQKGYNPRDRRLFENAVAKLENGSDYVAIRNVTGTDLIFEITQFKIDKYIVREYMQGNKKVAFNPKRKPNQASSYSFYGFSIEIKVILLSDNLIAGVYKYFYTPCSSSEGGCEIVQLNDNSIYYKLPKSDQEVENESQRDVEKDEQLDKLLGDFITNTVIPSLFSEMSKEPSIDKANVQTAELANTKQEEEQNNKSVLNKATEFVNRVGEEILGSNESNQKNEKIDSKEQVESDMAPSRNSYEMSGAVSELILQYITQQDPKKSKKYKTDEERFKELDGKNKEQIAKYITTITTNVSNSQQNNDNEVVFFCKRGQTSELPLILFLDGQCIGVGTRNKGLLTIIPKKTEGVHTLSLCYPEKELLNLPVDFKFKSIYTFEWSRYDIRLVN